MIAFEGLNTTSLGILEKSLDATILRNKVIANNIANADVPNFKKSEVAFETALKSNLQMQQKDKAMFPQLKTTHPQHIQSSPLPNFRNIEPRIHLNYNSTVYNNGSNVEIEKEIVELNKNQLQYSFLIDRIRSHFSNLSQWIKVV